MFLSKILKILISTFVFVGYVEEVFVPSLSHLKIKLYYLRKIIPVVALNFIYCTVNLV